MKKLQKILALILVAAVLLSNAAMAAEIYVQSGSGDQREVRLYTSGAGPWDYAAFEPNSDCTFTFDAGSDESIVFYFGEYGQGSPMQIIVRSDRGDEWSDSYFNGDPYYMPSSKTGYYTMNFLDEGGNEFYYCLVEVVDNSSSDDSGGEDSGDDYYEEVPSEPQVGWVSAPSIDIEPYADYSDGCYILDRTGCTIYFSVDGELSHYYFCIVDANSGNELIGGNVLDSYFDILEGSLEAGHTYEITVGAIPVNGTDGDAQYSYARIYVSEPEPEYIGTPSLSVGPEAGYDGVTVVDQASVIRLSWGADNAALYDIELLDSTGMAYLQNRFYDSAYEFPAGALPVGDYVLRARAYASDGNASDLVELWFRVGSSAPAEQPTEVPQQPEEEPQQPTEEPQQPGGEEIPSTPGVGQVRITVSPEKYNDGMPVVDIASDFIIEWKTENAVAYDVKIATANGVELATYSYVTGMEQPVPAGYLGTGEYVVLVTAYGADGSTSTTEQWFRMEAEAVVTEVPTEEPVVTEVPTEEPIVTEAPVQPSVGQVQITVSPEKYNDGMPVVDQASVIRLTWSADNAALYDIELLNSVGEICLEGTTGDVAYEVPADMLPADAYVLKVTAYGEDGSASYAEQWFRVEAEAVVTEAPTEAPTEEPIVTEAPTEAPVQPSVGQVQITVSPEMYNDGMPVVDQASVIRLTWSADNAALYDIELLNSVGEICLEGTTGDVAYEVPADMLPADAYVLKVTAYGEDGSASYAEQWFRVEAEAVVTEAPTEAPTEEPIVTEAPTEAPVQPSVGQVQITVSPEMYNDGMPVANVATDFIVGWKTENAVAYDVEMASREGEQRQYSQIIDTEWPMYTGTISVGEYVIRITAYGADGSTSYAEQWFRVEAEAVVTEAPTEEPVVTEAPTEEPVVTEEPTEAPTEEPVVTEAPTEEPTEEPAQTGVGQVQITVSPEMYNDGMPVANVATDFIVGWKTENAVAYDVEMASREGEQRQYSQIIDTEWPMYTGTISVGEYVIRITAYGADGSTSYAEQWFRVEAEAVVTEVPTEEPVVTEAPTEVPTAEPIVTEAPAETPTEAPTAEPITTIAPIEKHPTAPKIIANNQDVTGGELKLAMDTVTNLVWSADVADSYIVELVDETTGETLIHSQTAETSTNLMANNLIEEHAYVLRVYALVVGSEEQAMSEVRIAVEAAADEPLAVWLESSYREENGKNIVSSLLDVVFGWNLTADDLRVSIIDAQSGEGFYNTDNYGGMAGQYSIQLTAGQLEENKEYILKVELPSQAKSAQIAFVIETPQLVTLAPVPEQPEGVEPANITITPVSNNGVYTTMSGAGLLPLEVYMVPADATVEVEMTADTAIYPECSLSLYNYTNKTLIQSTDSTVIQRWSTSMKLLTPGDVYMLTVTPNVPGSIGDMFLFSAEALVQEPVVDGEFRLWFSNDNATTISYDLGGEAKEVLAFDQVSNLLLRWTDLSGVSNYDITLSKRFGSGSRTINNVQTSDEAYVMDADVIGLTSGQIYEVKVTAVETQETASAFFMFAAGNNSGANSFFENGQNQTDKNNNTSWGNTSSGGKQTISPVKTVSSEQLLSGLNKNNKVTANKTTSGTGSAGKTNEPITTIEPMTLTLPGDNSTDANGGTGVNGITGATTVNTQLQMDEDPQRIAAGAADQLRGKIISTEILNGIELVYQGNTVFQKQGAGVKRFNLNEFIIDTNATPWQGKEGEQTIEVYVTYQNSGAAATAAPTATASALQSLGFTMSMPALPTLAPVALGSQAASGTDRQKIGDIRVYIEPAAAAHTGTGNGLQLSLYDLTDTLERGAKRSNVAVESNVDFTWTAGAMDVGGNNVANAEMNWDGWVQAKYTDRVRFEVYATNGVRLTVNGQRVCDEWTTEPGRSFASSWIDVTAGEKFVIALDSYQLDAGGELKLYWEYESKPNEKEIVPTEYLYSTTRSLLGPDAIAAAVQQYSLNAVQEDKLNYISMLASDDRYSSAIISAVDAGEPIAFLLEGAGMTTAENGGSLHSQGRMDAMFVVVKDGGVVQFANTASALPDIPREGTTLTEGAVTLTYASVDSTSGAMPHLYLGDADVLQCVDSQCGYCGRMVAGENVWHTCFASNHKLEILPASGWALSAADVKAEQGITLNSQDFTDFAAIVEAAGKALVVVDHQYLDSRRLDYEWLYDNLGLSKLLGA